MKSMRVAYYGETGKKEPEAGITAIEKKYSGRASM
jgi:hypothetical protein